LVVDLADVAKQQLNRIKIPLKHAGLKYLEIPNDLFGAGIAVAFGQADYVILSVMAGGLEGQLLLTCGILKDIEHNRLEALEACNKFNQSNTAYPVFLHDAEIGWAVIMQQTHPIEVLLDSPDYLLTLVRSLPQIARQYRGTLAENPNVGGQPWVLDDKDVNSLLIRSMM
jgi:hypothetical protein